MNQFENIIQNMQLIIKQLEELSSIILENDKIKLAGVMKNHGSNVNNNTEKGEVNTNEDQTVHNEFSADNPNPINLFVGEFLDEVNNLNAADSSPLTTIEEVN